MKKYTVTAPSYPVNGNIRLEGSKSISNRLLIMRALSGVNFEIENLSPSDDTETLLRLLNSDDRELNVGAAGTTMRFLTSYFAISDEEKILTGSERMKKRPIKILVDALNALGADIEYLRDEGFPPIRIKGKKITGNKLSVRSDISSQYISSLLMIAPVLENGLDLELEGKISSFPYINMTLQTMSELGIDCKMEGNKISVKPGTYIEKKMIAESDWSAASYFFSICALSENSKIAISGLLPHSLQGDSVLTKLFVDFGVGSKFSGDDLVIQNENRPANKIIFDFSDCPDIAQTAVVAAAGLGIELICSGLESLRIKETDRTLALQNELKKVNVDFIQDGDQWVVKGKSKGVENIAIQTYDDHRMAMCFAPLALKLPSIRIEDPLVVNKSYPSFWSDLRSIGFTVSES